jgi:hypothetical protein
MRILANNGAAVDYHVRLQPHTVRQLNVIADN